MNRLLSGIAGGLISFFSFRHGLLYVVMASLLLPASWAEEKRACSLRRRAGRRGRTEKTSIYCRC